MPRHYMAALLGGLALALLVALPSAALERGARTRTGRLPRAVRAAFTPSNRAPVQSPVPYDDAPIAVTSGSTFGEDAEPSSLTPALAPDTHAPETCAPDAQETSAPTKGAAAQLPDVTQPEARPHDGGDR